jgi:sigma-B regulation protein RsbU (phosphoserine phosphatase)
LDEPDRTLSFINENLCKVNKESFVTAVYAVYDTARRMLKIACAGHPLPILYRFSEKSAAEIPCDSVLLMGLGPYAEVPVSEVALHPGDRLLFYTDGVTDRFNATQECYGTKRLLQQFADVVPHDPKAILNGISDDLSRFAGGCPASDDQAMLAIVVD